MTEPPAAPGPPGDRAALAPRPDRPPACREFPATDDPWAAGAQLRDALSSGSCLAVTHPAADFNPAQINTVVTAATEFGMPLTTRTREQGERFFGDWELPAPGICPVSAWRPDEPVDDPNGAYYWAGVARKPWRLPPATRRYHR